MCNIFVILPVYVLSVYDLLNEPKRRIEIDIRELSVRQPSFFIFIYYTVHRSYTSIFTRNIRNGLSLSRQIPASACCIRMACSSLLSNLFVTRPSITIPPLDGRNESGNRSFVVTHSCNLF